MKNALLLIIALAGCLALPAAAQKHRQRAAGSTRNAFSTQSLPYIRPSEYDGLYHDFAREVMVQEERMPEAEFERKYREFAPTLKSITNDRLQYRFRNVEGSYEEYEEYWDGSPTPDQRAFIRREYLSAFRETVRDSLYSPRLGQYMRAESEGDGDRMTAFDALVVVQSDGTLDVTEDIRIYNYTNKAHSDDGPFQHGIFRTYPTTFMRWLLETGKATIEVTDVQQDGKEAKYKVSALANGINIRIGDSKRYLSSGAHHYRIRYRTTGHIRRDGVYDGLYLNIIANDFGLRILKASCTLVLPKGARIPEGANSCYTGERGGKGKDCTLPAEGAGDTLVFTVNKPLEHGEGFTIATSWQKGLVRNTAENQYGLEDFVRANIVQLLVPLIFLFSFVFCLIVWLWRGRDPRRGVVVPAFEPPAGYGPTELAYIREEGFKPRVLAATLADWAARDLIRICVAEEDKLIGKRITYQVTAGKDRVPEPPYQNWDSYADSLVDTTISPKVFHRDLLSIANRVASDLEKQHWREEANKDAAQQDRSDQRDHPNATRRHNKIVGYAKRIGMFESNAGYRGWLGMLAWLGFFATIGLMARNHGNREMLIGSAVYGIGGLILCIANQHLWAALLPRHTRQGRALLDKVDGFRMYLTAADLPRINMMSPPEKTIELYEKYLPYAVALDCETEWGAQFEHIIQENLARAPQQSQRLSSMHLWSDRNFFQGFSDTLATASISSSSGGSGGGSFGGGSSGGGSGGGSVGGW